jgi:hypothetical protein
VSQRQARRRERELERWRPVAYPEPGGLVSLRLTRQQAEVLQQLGAAAADAFPDRWIEGRWDDGPDHLRLLQ